MTMNLNLLKLWLSMLFDCSFSSRNWYKYDIYCNMTIVYRCVQSPEQEERESNCSFDETFDQVISKTLKRIPLYQKSLPLSSLSHLSPYSQNPCNLSPVTWKYDWECRTDSKVWDRNPTKEEQWGLIKNNVCTGLGNSQDLCDFYGIFHSCFRYLSYYLVMPPSRYVQPYRHTFRYRQVVTQNPENLKMQVIIRGF